MSLPSYHEITQGCGLVVLEDLCWIEARGSDAEKFFNGVLSNDIRNLPPCHGAYACLLTPKGKMLADLFCHRCGDHFGIVCSVSLKTKILETLQRYIIFQKVILSDPGDRWKASAVVGPKAKEFLKTFFKVLPDENLEAVETSWSNFPVWIIQRVFWGLEGLEIWMARENFPKLEAALSLPQLDPSLQEVLRIESATPLYGVDMDENTIPQEVNLYSALSFDKGCYVGQEVVARLEHRGHVGKKLVQIQLEGKEAPKRGEKIFSTDGKEIGLVTSACFSPKYNAPLALGYLRYAFVSCKEVLVEQKKGSVLRV